MSPDFTKVRGLAVTGPYHSWGLLTSCPHSQCPHLQGSALRPGHSFLRDGASLGMLRELMVVIRIWGLLKPSCLPVYTATSDTQDSMSLLFRLLTKLWICCKASQCPLLASSLSLPPEFKPLILGCTPLIQLGHLRAEPQGCCSGYHSVISV